MERPIIRWTQWILAVALFLAGMRAAWVYVARRAAPVAEAKKEAPLEPDYYVTPRKLRAYDLKSAKELTKQPVWVREGYKSSYYPYDRAQHHADTTHEAGQLGPIEKLEIQDVVLDATPGHPNYRLVVAVFDKGGKSYAFPVGTEQKGEYEIYIDELLYIQDPHELYKHWPPEVWQEVERHEAKPGMNELQVAFAVGMGIPRGTGAEEERVVDYPNGGKPLAVSYRSGRAVSVEAGKAP